MRANRLAVTIVRVVIWLSVCLPVSVVLGDETPEAPQGGPIILKTRSRVEAFRGSGQFEMTEGKIEWDPAKTAVIVCDVWEDGSAYEFNKRVAQFVPALNRVLDALREKGVLVVHGAGGGMGYYKDHPGRKLALEAPTAANMPKGIERGCGWIDGYEKKAGLPLDVSDGGFESPRLNQGFCDRRVNQGIEIRPGEIISDSGMEIWNVFEQRGIDNVVFTGVAANMCAVARPFALRNLSRFGKNVVFVRDLTDVMYNPEMPPFVSHHAGTDLMIEHIEKYICPTVESTDLTGQPRLYFADDTRPYVVFVHSKSDSPSLLARFADDLQVGEKFAVRAVMHATGDKSQASRLAASLAKADLVVLDAERLFLSRAEIEALRTFVDAGKGLVATLGGATSSDAWLEFQRDVLGADSGRRTGNRPGSVKVSSAAKKHSILAEIEMPFTAIGPTAEVRMLNSATPLLLASVAKQNQPVAWTHKYKNARVFATSLGGDPNHPQLAKLLRQAMLWTLDRSEF